MNYLSCFGGKILVKKQVIKFFSTAHLELSRRKYWGPKGGRFSFGGPRWLSVQCTY